MNQINKKTVAVLMGGWSAEREVSLISGKAISKALNELGHEVQDIDVSKNVISLSQSLLGLKGNKKPDVVFNALHGRGGEDGTLQALFDMLGLPYTHSGLLASAIAMDKPAMKAVAAQAGVRCALHRIVTRKEIAENGFPFSIPFVIKPINEGSSVGVHIVKTQKALEESLIDVESDNWAFGERVMIESYIAGHELTVAVLGDKKEAKALGVTELRPINHEFYDYTAKYSDGQTEHIVPAPIPQDVYDEAMHQAVLAFHAAGCQGAARADFRWDDTKAGTEGIVFLELNTQPGMTPLSLLPEQAKYADMSFNMLIQWMLDHPTWPV